MTENCKFRRAILSAFYNISQRNSHTTDHWPHRLLITGLTLHWKYHAPNESKLLYRGCLASFENRKFCIKLSKFYIKLSKIQSRKNIGIFFRYRFSGFFKYRNSLASCVFDLHSPTQVVSRLHATVLGKSCVNRP
jgi:hypothetical protein